MFGLGTDRTVQLVYLVALLAFIIGFGFLRRGARSPPENQDPRSTRGAHGARRAGGLRAQHLLIWAIIVMTLVAVYAYRAPLLHFTAPILQELNPSRAVEVVNAEGETELVIVRGPDGHFHLDAKVNGASVRFLVDTGATGTVLTVTDAKRGGIDTAALDFNRPVQTANGTAHYARATLESLEIGPWRLSSVPVGIMPDEALGTSLLGMSTIDRFASFRIEGDRMVLVP